MSAPSLDIRITDADIEDSLRADVLTGLSSSPKTLPPKWFYDARGSELFTDITALAEYYPTRTERSLLERHAGDIAAAADAETIVELGSGSSEKTRVLLRAAVDQGALNTYVPQDVSESALAQAVTELQTEFPTLRVHGIVSDFTHAIPALPHSGRRMIAFLGGTLGNLNPVERAEFLGALAGSLDDGGTLLLGVGLVTDVDVMEAAYDDADGVTAAFDKNVLTVLNGRLGANFDLDDFEHVAVWNPEDEWIEMRLRARRDLTVRVDDLDIDVPFSAGESIRTEISAKFRRDGITTELATAGFRVADFWTDPRERFGLILAARDQRSH
ncbi:L-histidine N(alpha)-methyltransferase [Williamsia sterculiae]|uniref:Histidine N-alpha-methyltransferase n=1 Tax=Williamsia sterculiae TaxID=1344003 RepID=A0A1N7FLI7_9NOCA|nr:L-histidine N(alpha)-methyltransferase [Williamsia sterculiae]SIS01191.1 L-histidine Nalpha-methyltransferase [Williamsia sterculiae]